MHGRSSLAAFVLHHWDWSESSLILDLFTREQGRLVAVARGAKKPHSNLRAVLLPFQRIQVLLGRAGADGEVQNLRGAEWAAGAALPPGAGLFGGFYANELLMKLLARHDPHPALWDAYARLVGRLAAAETAAALRAFELVLLKETGVLPDLGVSTQTQQPLSAGGAYALRPDAGLAPAAGEATAVPGAVWLRLREALAGAPAAADAGALEAACAAAPAELRAMLRALLHYHLGAAPLRTREVARSLQELR